MSARCIPVPLTSPPRLDPRAGSAGLENSASFLGETQANAQTRLRQLMVNIAGGKGIKTQLSGFKRAIGRINSLQKPALRLQIYEALPLLTRMIGRVKINQPKKVKDEKSGQLA